MKLEIKNISKQYGKKTVLQGVSQEFSGGVYGLLGPNGAGKTTLLNIIATVLKASAGTICYEQKNVFDDLAGYHSMVGYLPQKIGFYTHFTGYDMMKYMHYLKGGDRKNTRQIDELLQRVNLYDVKDNKIATYSGGMKQRVIIAMALACNPDLLLADEPTTALDVTIQAQVLDLIAELRQKYNTAMLLITHDMGVVAQTCDQVAVIYAGNIIEYGTKEQIFDHPSHPYTIGLFGAIPSMSEDEEWLHPIEGLPPDPSDLPSGCAFHPRCEYACEECKKESIAMYQTEDGHQCRCCRLGQIRKGEEK